MPVIRFDRQPPPSATARQVNVPLLKSRWQKIVGAFVAVAFKPSDGHGSPGPGVPGGVAIAVLVATAMLSADRDVPALRVAELDGVGLSVIVVKTMAGRVEAVVATAVPAGLLRGAVGRPVVVPGTLPAFEPIVDVEGTTGVELVVVVVVVDDTGEDAAGGPDG